MDMAKIGEASPLKGRTVSASIEVPKPSRMRKTSEEPTMTELMAAMVLSNLSCSPVFHNPPIEKGSFSPQTFNSNELEPGSWNRNSHSFSPIFIQPGSSNQPVVHTNSEKCKQENVALDSSSSGVQSDFVSDDPIEVDSGTILLQRSTPTPTKHPKDEKNNAMDVSEEPQDLRMPKLHVEELSIKQGSPAILHQEPKENETKHVLPISIPVLPQQIPLSYYLAPGFVRQPYAASLPGEFRMQLANSSPHQSPEIGSSAPGHMDSKIHRHLYRSVPYHKVSEDMSVPSPAGGSSPSTITFGSAPTGYYPFSNSPIPVASLSFSPSHYTKSLHVRSPLASTSQTSPYSSPAKSASVSLPAGYAILRDHPYPNISGWPNNCSTNFTVKSSVVQPGQQMQESPSPKTQFSLSPKSLPLGRKVRGDGKKCRKVYGMENRDMWCTACRWKKACQRFPD
ncbi:uncharacterized protein LOC143465394 [Clavelina lepadiformis]|uniref:uncharacterized protein LOC143465394 n=1 Tax=Clavelina lepadiformis TaxID=159417 RepID=UPI004043380E